MNDVFIVGAQSVFPPLYDSSEVTDILYSEKLSSAKTNKFANRLGKSIQIKNRSISIDLAHYPLKIVSQENSPVEWAKKVYRSFSGKEDKAVEFVSVSYNSSSHATLMPNLACQIANACRFRLQAPPQEIVHYGCASGIFSIQSALEFCQKRESLAFVFAFEQSSWVFKPIYDENNPNFKASLRTHTIFGDGGAGVLIASGEKAERFEKRLKIIDIQLGFEYGDVIDMKEGYFFTRDGVKNLMPDLVSRVIIKPLLSRNHLRVEEIPEWSIHQGGIPVLETFLEEEVLGLTPEQIRMSKTMFEEHGNISTPSTFVVFEQQYNRQDARSGDYGMIVGFGAGYYLGALLYQRC